VVVDGAAGHEEPVGDLDIRHVLGEMSQHVHLARRQPERVLSRRPGGAPGDTAHAGRGELGAKPGGERHRSQLVEDGE